MSHVLYSEWVPTSKYLRATLLATAAFIVIILVAVTVFIQPSGTSMLIGFGVSAAVLVLMLFGLVSWSVSCANWLTFLLQWE